MSSRYTFATILIVTLTILLHVVIFLPVLTDETSNNTTPVSPADYRPSETTEYTFTETTFDTDVVSNNINTILRATYEQKNIQSRESPVALVEAARRISEYQYSSNNHSSSHVPLTFINETIPNAHICTGYSSETATVTYSLTQAHNSPSSSTELSQYMLPASYDRIIRDTLAEFNTESQNSTLFTHTTIPNYAVGTTAHPDLSITDPTFTISTTVLICHTTNKS